MQGLAHKKTRPVYLELHRIRPPLSARYGFRDWLAQRVSAVIIALYAVVVMITVAASQPVTYSTWKHLLTQGWMQTATLLFALALAWHMWVGMRDILMDYVKPTGWRLALRVGMLLTITWYVLWLLRLMV